MEELWENVKFKDGTKTKGTRLRSDYSDLLGLRFEIVEVLELFHAYGMIHTVKNVSYTNGTHEQTIHRARALLDKLRK